MHTTAKDTRDFLQPNENGTFFQNCDSRSLLLERYVDPSLEKEERRIFFENTFKKTAYTPKCEFWLNYLTGELGMPTEDIIFARLESRLMVNMSGGVMENASICLDRFGIPYIPGSAVKGCARRFALHALSQTESKKDKINLLTKIALVFGWGETEWEDGRTKDRNLKSDFEYACGETWRDEIRYDVAEKLLQNFNNINCSHPDKPWKDLPHFAGRVSFLPAYPVCSTQLSIPNMPRTGSIELDIVNCHNQNYYNGKWPYAADCDDPIPVVFPAVEAGHTFMFAARPMRHCAPELAQSARQWLKDGLETFSIGAKTNAGYGWFKISDEIYTAISGKLDALRQAKEEQRIKEEEKREQERREKEKQAKKEEEQKKLASMTPEQREDFLLEEEISKNGLRYLLNYDKLDDRQKDAAYRYLKNNHPDSWKQLKQKAESGKQKERKLWTPFVQKMNQIAKQNKEKMP